MKFYSDSVGTACIDVDALPWVPFLPYSDQLHLKLIKLNPINGEWTSLLRVPAGMEMPKHHHAGTVHVYTIQGKWRYKEHDWVAARQLRLRNGGLCSHPGGRARRRRDHAEHRGGRLERA